MKILLVSMKYDYGNPSSGLSNNETYFQQPLSKLAASVIPYDFMSVFHEYGRDQMNRDLLETVRREQPDIAIFVPFTDQFIPAVIEEINRYTITIGYLFDDTWRIQYSKSWSKHFQYVTTSDVNGVKRWSDQGCKNFLFSPFGCNPEIFRRKADRKIHDVSFVGHYHPYRAWCLKRLKSAGIDVKAWGSGWPSGYLDMEGMISVFNQSKVNINLSNNESWDFRYIASFSRSLLETMRVFRQTMNASKRADRKTREMVKARNFEISACGGFQLTYFVEGLERHYKIGEEIAIYESVDDMIDKTRYFLKNEAEREEIANNGYARTIRDHTMEMRFKALFNSIGAKTN